MKLLIKNGTVITMDSSKDKYIVTDILIEDDTIIKIDNNISDEVDKVIDASNKIVLPGLINCHIANYGFVGIGICTASSVAMTRFTVSIDGKDVPISEVEWVNPLHKSKLDPDGEIFIRVDWKSYVEDLNDGYWEKGMTSIPLVAYKLNDQTTYQKVRQRFGYRE